MRVSFEISNEYTARILNDARVRDAVGHPPNAAADSARALAIHDLKGGPAVVITCDYHAVSAVRRRNPLQVVPLEAGIEKLIGRIQCGQAKSDDDRPVLAQL